MKNLLLFLCLIALSFNSIAQNSIKFRIKNAGMTTNGYFGSFKPLVNWDKDNPSKCKFIGTVNVSSINTASAARDKHLKNADFFDVAKYPNMKFESTSVTMVSANLAKITGKLTIKDVTKTVTFETRVTYSGSKVSFDTSLLINRLDYNVGTSSWTLANDLYIDLHIEK